MVSDITAVIGVYINEERRFHDTIQFLTRFWTEHPDVPVSISCVGTPENYQEALKDYLEGRYEPVLGKTERVSFSETWNTAIENVKTSKFVFLHNDMILAPDFFEKLDGYYLSDPKDFYVYTTIEPVKTVGFPRPGKVMANFGEDWDDFREEDFLRFVKRYQESHRLRGRGYGFYIAGFTESLRNVGGFDYLTFVPCFCEDDDLMIRIRKKGYELYTAPGAVVYHFGSKTTRDLNSVGMSRAEIESNRNFARKWGFEARYLWETGYETQGGVLDTGAERVGFTWVQNVSLPLNDVLNIEPLVDQIACTDPKYLEYLKGLGLPEKSGNLSDCDIVITQTGPGNFNSIAYLLGDLRFYHGNLEVGATYQVDNYSVSVRNVNKDMNRLDPRNYLSLLKEQYSNERKDT